MPDSDGQKLSREASLALARQGSGAWNEWAEENQGTEVNFSSVDFTADDNKKISFSNFSFPGPVNFSEAVFDGASFEYVKFWGDVDFLLTRFTGHLTDFEKVEFIDGKTTFGGTIFEGDYVNFRGAKFSGETTSFSASCFNGIHISFEEAQFVVGEANFEDVTFVASVDFDNASFSTVPDFRRTKLAAHFTCQSMKILAPKLVFRESQYFRETFVADAADKFRRLKELAILAKDHDREQEFFAGEIRAKRFHETKGAALVWSYLYEWCSDFGRSTTRPLTLLLWTWFVCGIGYFLAAGIIAGDPTKSLLDGFRLSAATLVPFVAVSKSAMGTAQKNLFGDHVPFGVDAAAFVEGILGLAFVFLIGLAMRNRFRI
jgi:hypothetical protein